MVLDNFTPRMVRALLPQAPLGANLILGNSATVQLTCDCYSKSESDGRYFFNSDVTPWTWTPGTMWSTATRGVGASFLWRSTTSRQE